MAFRFDAVSFFFKYIWPPAVFAEVCVLFGEWQSSGIKNKAILSVFFIPALLSLGGLVLCVAYFVLFKLPSFILSVLGWLLLISIFSGGGLFCYDRFFKSPGGSGTGSYEYEEVTVTVEDGKDGARNASGKWFDGFRRSK
jgi:hypothetical protein